MFFKIISIGSELNEFYHKAPKERYFTKKILTIVNSGEHY
jgi:hypothetical protein